LPVSGFFALAGGFSALVATTPFAFDFWAAAAAAAARSAAAALAAFFKLIFVGMI
jgi:hypothetical protein